jgi:hypothetical protein
MSTSSQDILHALENYLGEFIRQNEYLHLEEIEPARIVYQISEDLSKKRFIWLGNETYIPNRLVGHFFINDADQLEELEVMFNSGRFRKLLQEYITSRGFKFLGELRVIIRYDPPNTTSNKFLIEFCWPTENEAAEDLTVKIDEAQGRILEVYHPQPEIPRLARLSILNGEVYRDNYLITKCVTHIGRLRNVIDKATGKLIRHNDFVYARDLDPESPNGTVSRQQATIRFENNNFYLYDDGSANGTSVERAGLAPLDLTSAEKTTGVMLENYDIIRLGTALIRFEDNAQIGLNIDIDAIQPFIEGEIVGHTQTTVKLTREQIQTELRKLLDSE